MMLMKSKTSPQLQGQGLSELEGILSQAFYICLLIDAKSEAHRGKVTWLVSFKLILQRARTRPFIFGPPFILYVMLGLKF